MKEKLLLLRIVRDKDGNIFLDSTGKKSGRGAYICKEIKCFEAAKKDRKLEKAFGTKISDEVYDSLRGKLCELG